MRADRPRATGKIGHKIRLSTDDDSARLKRLALVALLLAIATAYGKCASLIPSPSDPSAFWVGNTAAPWLAITFISGAVQTRALASVLVGAAADVTIVAAFYSNFLFLDHGEDGLSLIFSWIDFVGPWFGIAILGGAIYGYIGYVWRARRLRLGAVLLGLPFVTEVLVQRVTDGQWPGSWGFFAALALLGAILSAIAWTVVETSRSSTDDN